MHLSVRAKLGLGALAMLMAGVVLFFRGRRPAAPPSLPEPSLQGNSASPTPPEPPPRSWPTPFSVKVRELPPKDELPPGTLRILVVGDSVAKFLGLAMRYRQDEAKAFVAERGVGSCNIFPAKTYLDKGKPVLSSSCSMHWADDVAELRPEITLIVMGGAFFNEKSCERSFQLSYQNRIFELVKAMGANAGRVVITRVPYPMGHWRHSNVQQRVDCFNKLLVETAGKARLPMLDLILLPQKVGQQFGVAAT